jgi:hypothetical protein
MQCNLRRLWWDDCTRWQRTKLTGIGAGVRT